MSNSLEISLEEIAKELKNKGFEDETLEDVLDLLYGIGLNTANVISLAHGGFTVSDFFKDFKPSKFISHFMPKKYINVTKEEHALLKYKKLTITNLLIILASYNQAILKEKSKIEKAIKQSMKDDPKLCTDKEVSNIKEQLITDKKTLYKLQYQLPDENNSSTYEYIDKLLQIQEKIFNIWLYDHDNNTIIKRIRNLTIQYYYINLLEISEEFPEVKLWIDLQFHKEMTASNNKLEKTIQEIKEYQNKSFTNQFGLIEMEQLLSKHTNTQLESLENILDQPTLQNIQAHHHFIQDTVREELLDENDVEELILPKRGEIYIPQSYKYFYYKEKLHKKNYLDSSNWSDIDHKNDEDIGKELFHALKNPHNMDQPIIILGHPGAGKSMLSSMLAYKLIDNNEFVPFLIKLRNVDSSITDIDEHINKGIQITVAGNPVVNWVEWAKKFPDKIPVIILDGFDELLRASQTQLNDYIINIQKLQIKAQHSNLSIRVILTSRLTIMQDVKIPEDSLVIKLNSFDRQRKRLWIEKWNEKQLNNKEFILPERDDLDELSKEPLLLFLLALYDFEDNALSKVAKEGLSKSSLYDKLFTEFTKRQLRKNTLYNGSSPKIQKEMEDLFRLRIGFFALMIFTHDRVHHLEKDFDEELNVFSLSDENNKAKNILDGFFFVHKDKSTDGHDTENLSFEFLHKTFGEFLAADFMLRIALLKAYDDEDISHLSNEKYFRQVFSFQWIHKQPKILDFLLEHSKSIFDTTSYTLLVKVIKKELKTLVDESTTLISPVALHQFKTFEKLKHIAIYSQNLILLWISLEDDSFEFHLSKNIDNIKSWKIFVDLWKNYGEYEYVSYLTKYIDVHIDNSNLIIDRKKGLNRKGHYTEYSGYTHIANNYYETILSYYESSFTLKDLSQLYNLKDSDLYSSITNLIITKLDYLYLKDKKYFNNDLFWRLWEYSHYQNKIKLLSFFIMKNINFNQKEAISNLFNEGIHGKELLSPSESLHFIELFVKINDHRSPDYTKKMLNRLFEEIGYTKKGLSLSEELRFIELYLELEGNRRTDYAKKMLVNFSKKIRTGLSLSEELRFVELSLSVNDNLEYTTSLFKNLSKKLMRQRKELPISEELRFIELYLELEGNPVQSSEAHQMLTKMLEDIYFQSKRLSPSENLKFIELYSVLGIHKQHLENILENLPKYLKIGNGPIAKKIKKLKIN